MVSATADASRTRRTELILRQVETLPTLPAIAARLLALTTDDESSADQVIELVKDDPALTARLISLCRRAKLGVREDTLTIDRVVLLLGFTTVRNAVLSLKVLEAYGCDGGSGADAAVPGLDRQGFWQHSLAVAVCCEQIAAAHRGSAASSPSKGRQNLPPGEAFVCGLLHDVGKLALEMVLPKAYGRVIELAELNHGNIAEFERRILGLDHHTAGKRLAEHWQLPHVLQDCIWLHGSAYELLPGLDHRAMIGLVSLADLLVRRQHIGYSGNFVMSQRMEALCEALGLESQRVEQVATSLYAEVCRRTELLGLEEQPTEAIFFQAVQRANEALGRLNAALDRRSRVAVRQARTLEAIVSFHAAAHPAATVQDTIDRVALTAAAALGQGYYAVLHQERDPRQPGHGGRGPWLICQYDAHGRPRDADLIDAPPHAPDLERLGDDDPMALSLMAMMPWLADHLHAAPDLREVRLLPLISGWGTAAVLLHDRPSLPPREDLAALTRTWGAAIAAAAQHEGARRLGEELAESNSRLAEAQEKLLRSATMARLGEMAAGAAHEMNNPLAVISGRSQLLTQVLIPGSEEQKTAQRIVEQAHRLSDLISALRMFADPPVAERRPTKLDQLLNALAQELGRQLPEYQKQTPISVQVDPALPPVDIDAQQIAQAVRELLLNAVQAMPQSTVHVAARLGPEPRTLTITVTDDGAGMDKHTLEHATDPFFSAKPAGRRTGMGLPRAQQLARAHGGELRLRSTPGRGTTATLLIRLKAATDEAKRPAA
jgi:signal transduction histidine kinase/HD-like signal output (HDOD) protein